MSFSAMVRPPVGVLHVHGKSGSSRIVVSIQSISACARRSGTACVRPASIKTRSAGGKNHLWQAKLHADGLLDGQVIRLRKRRVLALCTSVAMHAAARYHAVSAATVVARPLA